MLINQLEIRRECIINIFEKEPSDAPDIVTDTIANLGIFVLDKEASLGYMENEKNINLVKRRGKAKGDGNFFIYNGFSIIFKKTLAEAFRHLMKASSEGMTQRRLDVENRFSRYENNGKLDKLIKFTKKLVKQNKSYDGLPRLFNNFDKQLEKEKND